MEQGDEEDNLQQTAHKKAKTIIKIPSYQEVVESSQPKSQSFSQAFAFLKSSEFYSPPPNPTSASSSQSLPASDITNTRCPFRHFPFQVTVSFAIGVRNLSFWLFVYLGFCVLGYFDFNIRCVVCCSFQRKRSIRYFTSFNIGHSN